MKQLRVLHINKFHYLRGGSETVYFKTANFLESYGHKSFFFSMSHPDNLPCETSGYFMPYLDMNADGKEGVAGQLTTAGRILFSFDAKKRLSRLLDEHHVDIAHLHNIHHQISPSILYELKKRKIPVVMTIHDYKMVCATYLMLADGKPCDACREGKYFQVIKKKCTKKSFAKSTLAALEMYLHHKILDIYNKVDVFISPSLFLKNKLKNMGFKKPIIHLPNFIDIEQLRTGRSGEHVSENSVVYSGRLSPEKGLWTLINAARKVDTDIKIKVIGDGPLKGPLNEKVRADGIKNVRFLGYMTGEALYDEIKKSKAVVIPSEWYENNPASILESFALCTPVIGSRIGGIPELVNDYKTGLTFEPGDTEDLSKKIKMLLDDDLLAAEMGRMCHEFAKKELRPERHYNGLMDIYRQVIS